MIYRSKKIIFSLFIAAILGLPSFALAETINIAVAANFENAMEELISTYNGGTYGTVIKPVYDASGTFDAAIRNGNTPKYSLFFSADNIRPQDLAALAVPLARNVQDYAIGKLAAYSRTVNFGQNNGINTMLALIEFLQGTDFISGAVANPSLAPYGVAAQQFLSNSEVNLWGDSRIDATYINIGTTFDAAYNQVKQVAFVAYAQTKGVAGNAMVINQSFYSPIIQSACEIIVNVSDAAKTEAAAFYNWVQTTQTAKDIIIDWGYDLP